MVILQDDNDDDKAASLLDTSIAQWRLGFDNNEDINTGTRTGVNVYGSTSASKDDGKSITPFIERLIQSEGTSDFPIIRWLYDVYTIDITTLFVK